ncbi:MAG: hypothetical protein K5868_00310 [Lachnospiraceae bacterium]|nr:hypothetical protein [Lachnospiraceae bacterium]
MGKDKSFLTSSEKRALKEQKKRKGVAILVLLLILSLALNVFLLLQNTTITKFSITDKIPLLDTLTADNTEFEQFIDEYEATFDFTVNDGGKKTEYLLFNNGDKSTLWVLDNGSILSMTTCDFTIDKWNELRTLVLKRQLRWYNASEHVDSKGRIIDRDNDKYVMNLGKYSILAFSALDAPRNSADIEKFFVHLAADAQASPDKKTDTPANAEEVMKGLDSLIQSLKGDAE